MDNKRLIRMFITFFITPLLILSIISAVYLMVVVKQDAMKSIKDEIDIYDFFLVKEASQAISLGDSYFFQKTIDELIKTKGDHLLSIELLDINRNIVASAPELPDLDAPAIRIPVTSPVPKNDDLFEVDDNNSAEVEVVGYVIIRYNNKLTASAIDRISSHLIILFIIITILLLITFKLIVSRIIKPFDKFIRRVNRMSQNDLSVHEVENNYLSDKFVVLNKLAKLLRSDRDKIENLETQLVASKSNVDIVNLTKIEMMNELTSKLGKLLSTSRDLITSIGRGNKNASLSGPLNIVAGCLDNAQNSLNDTKTILDRSDMFVSIESVKIIDFYKTIEDAIDYADIKVVKAFLCDQFYYKHYITVDSTHYNQLIGKLVYMAGRQHESLAVYINTKIEVFDSETANISIDIKDTSKGLSMDDVNSINKYVRDETRVIDIDSIDIDALRIIKYLVNASNMHFNMTSEQGRGNRYHLSHDCQYSTSPASYSSFNASALSGVFFNNGSPEKDLRTHLKHIGIDIKYRDMADGVGKLNNDVDFVIIDFSMNSLSDAEKLCKNIKNSMPEVLIIAAINSKQSENHDLMDLILSLGVGKVMTRPYSAATLIDILKVGDTADKQLISKLLTKFTNDEYQ